jgi:hypothetical protein
MHADRDNVHVLGDPGFWVNFSARAASFDADAAQVTPDEIMSRNTGD